MRGPAQLAGEAIRLDAASCPVQSLRGSIHEQQHRRMQLRLPASICCKACSRGPQVGGFTMMRTEDLKRVAPVWIKYSEDVRADPDAWNTSGDSYTKVTASCWAQRPQPAMCWVATGAVTEARPGFAGAW